MFIMNNPWFISYLSDFSTTCYLSVDCVFIKLHMVLQISFF
jgi:hypothetical protein